MSRLTTTAWCLTTAQWVLTTSHHAYAGILFGTGWRLEGLSLGVIAFAASIWAWRRGRRLLSLWVSTVFFGFVIGIVEGGYNHVIKEALYALAFPQGVLDALFPPPVYEPPGDLLFEVTGALQLVVGAALMVANHRLMRRHTPTREPAGRPVRL